MQAPLEAVGIEAGRRAGPGATLRNEAAARLSWLFGLGARQGMVSLVDQALVSGTNFFTSVIIGRICGADELGVYSLAFTILWMTLNVQMSLITLPYTIYGNRLEGRRRAEYAGAVLSHFLMLAVAAVLCLALAAVVLLGIGPAGLAAVIAMLAGSIGFVLLREFARRLALAHLHTTTALWLDLGTSVVQIAGLLILAALGTLSAVTAYVVIGLACAVAGLAWLACARGDFAVKRGRVFKELKRNWLFGRWVFAAAVTWSVHGYVVYWILAFALDTTATGVFAACMTLIMFANPVMMGIGNVLMPKSAQAAARGGSVGVRRIVVKATLVLGGAMAAYCLLIMLIGDPLMQLLYKEPVYAGHGHVLIVLALGKLIASLGSASDSGLWAIERPDMGFVANLLAACTTLSATACLLSGWGILGAAYALLAGDLVGAGGRCVAFFWLSRNWHGQTAVGNNP